jgi:hypothetical protein
MRRSTQRWVELPDGTHVLFGIGMVKPSRRGLFEAMVRDESLGFFRTPAESKAEVEKRARTLGLLTKE